MNGSMRKNGCTAPALTEVAKSLEAECIACGRCADLGRCVFRDDIVNLCIGKARAAGGFVFAPPPVHYTRPSGQLPATMDRMFCAGGDAFAHKPAAAVVTARRAGNTASLNAIQKHSADAPMPIASSAYWDMVFGLVPELVAQDQEGLQTMRNLGRNVARLLKCIYLGREHGVTLPTTESQYWTNFNRGPEGVRSHENHHHQRQSPAQWEHRDALCGRGARHRTGSMTARK